MAIELLAMRAELESNKSEAADNFQPIQRMCEDRRYAQSKVQLELEDAKNMIRELREVLSHDNNVKQSLGLQLQKTIESNSELLLEIQDLEKALQEKGRAIAKLENEVATLKERENSTDLDDAKVAWMDKIHEYEAENHQLREAITSLEAALREQASTDVNDLKKIISLLKENMENVESGAHDLRQENMSLMSQLKEIKYKMSTKEDLVCQLEAELVIIQDQSFFKEKTLEMETEKLQIMVNDIKEKLHLSEDEHQRQEKLISGLNSSINTLQLKNGELKMQLKSLEDKRASLTNELNDVVKESQEHERERALLASQRGQLKSLREKMAVIMEEHEKELKRAEDLELANATMRETNNEVMLNLTQELQSLRGKLLAGVEEQLELKIKLTQKEEEAVVKEKQVTSLLQEKEIAEISFSSLVVINAELEERRKHAEHQSSRALNEVHQCEAKFAVLLTESALTQEKLKDMEEKLLNVEATNVELEERYQKVQRERASHEHQLSAIKEEKDALSFSLGSAQDQLRKMEGKLSQLEVTIVQLEERYQKVLQESASLKGQLLDIKEEKDALSISLALIEQQLQEREGMLSELEATNVELEERYQKIQQENTLHKCQLSLSKQEKDALSKSLASIQDQLQDKEGMLSQLEAANIELKERCHMFQQETIQHVSSKTNLEHRLSGLKEEKDALTKSLTAFERKAKDLQLQNDNLSNKLQAALLSKEHLLEGANMNEAEKRGKLEDALQELNRLAMENDQTVVKFEERIINLEREKERQVSLAQGQLKHIEDTLMEAQTTKVALEEQLEKMQQEKRSQESRIGELESQLHSIKEETSLSRSKKFNSFRASLLHEMKLEQETMKASLQEVVMENERLHEELVKWKDKAKTGDEIIFRLKNHKLTLEERVQDLNAKGGKKGNELDQRSELARLRKQTNEQKRKILEHEEEKEELKKKGFSLQKELQRKADLLALTEKRMKDRDRDQKANHKLIKTQPKSTHRATLSFSFPACHDGEDVVKVMEKVNFLEGELKRKTVELEATKYILREKEAKLSKPTNEVTTTNYLSVDSDIGGLQKEREN